MHIAVDQRKSRLSLTMLRVDADHRLIHRIDCGEKKAASSQPWRHLRRALIAWKNLPIDFATVPGHFSEKSMTVHDSSTLGALIAAYDKAVVFEESAPGAFRIAKALPFVPWSKSTGDSLVKRAIAGAFRWLDKHPKLSHWFERFEYYGKKEVFGCQNCGNCVLGSMQYVCPQTCPKQMRNGPCGGVRSEGRCEVDDRPCPFVAQAAPGWPGEPPDRRGDRRPIGEAAELVPPLVVCDVRPPEPTIASARELARLHAGTFGTCERCGHAVSRERLDAVPYARHCIRCARDAAGGDRTG